MSLYPYGPSPFDCPAPEPGDDYPDDHPLMVCPVRGLRIMRQQYEFWRRRTMIGLQRVCPKCGAGIGEPCVSTTTGKPIRNVTCDDDGNHSERTPGMPRTGWADPRVGR